MDPIIRISSPFEVLVLLVYIGIALGLADSEHFRATYRADALSGRLTVFHGDSFSISDFSFSPAFNAISLHGYTSVLVRG